ncbi:MAG: hypothetical protein K6T74_01265 [Geminicoccaceae bacterium]|nr:hypothetical protein [Geminicoccaceae bacterium]
MARTTETPDVDRSNIWQVAAPDDEQRWPLYKTAFFVVTSSVLLWSGIFAVLGWLL